LAHWFAEGVERAARRVERAAENDDPGRGVETRRLTILDSR
jgi:hypothetical protein